MKLNPPPYRELFIVQWEIPNPRDQLERMYIVFDGVKEYSDCLSIGRYNTCHEVLVSPSFNPDDHIVGHPAFDLDLKMDREEGIVQFPHGWLDSLEEDLIHLLKVQYPSHVETMEPRFVWLTSPSTSKASKHLVIQGIIFNTWHLQMKILINGLKSLDKPYMKAIDNGIYRRLGSLRLPLNSKKPKEGIPQPALSFDDPRYGFTDGLVMIYDSTLKAGNLILWTSDLDPRLQEDESVILTMAPRVYYPPMDIAMEGPVEKAWSMIENRYHTGLQLGAAKGSYVSLQRVHPGQCPISGKIHDKDNAYLFVKGHLIFFACHRGCSFRIGNKEYKSIDITPHKASNANIHAQNILSSMKPIE